MPSTAASSAGRTARWITVVGIVGDVKHNGITRSRPSSTGRTRSITAPATPVNTGAMVVRTAGQPDALAGLDPAATRAIDASIPVVAHPDDDGHRRDGDHGAAAHQLGLFGFAGGGADPLRARRLRSPRVSGQPAGTWRSASASPLARSGGKSSVCSSVMACGWRPPASPWVSRWRFCRAHRGRPALRGAAARPGDVRGRAARAPGRRARREPATRTTRGDGGPGHGTETNVALSNPDRHHRLVVERLGGSAERLDRLLHAQQHVLGAHRTAGGEQRLEPFRAEHVAGRF